MKKHIFSVTLKDCRVDTFCVSGAGGGGKDTSNTGVRITHIDSGAVGRSVETRSQDKNKRTAFARMAKTKEFKNWVRIQVARLQAGKSIEEIVDESMKPSNLFIEVKDEKNRWIGEQQWISTKEPR